MRKTLIYLLALLLIVGCGSSLGENFDEDQIDKNIQRVLGSLHSKSDEELFSLSTEELSAALRGSTDQVYSLVEEAGDYKNIIKTSKADFTDPKNETTYALCKVKVEYENKNILYTMSFTEDSLLAGLFLN